MKKSLLLLTLFWALLGTVQATIVTIGEGSSTAYYPMPGFYGYQYDVYLYTLDAADALNYDCDIASIAYDISSNSATSGAQISIWVKDVEANYTLAAATTFGDYITDAVQVYDDKDLSTSAGWNTFTFSSSFSHEGGKALLVAVYGVGCTNGGGCSRNVHSTSANGTHWYKHVDTTDPGTSVSGALDASRSNIQLDVTFSSTPCFAPSGLVASGISHEAATLSWTENGEATAWVLEYGTASDFTGATSVNVSGTASKDLTGLTPQTTYYARVKADCESAWSAALSFSTTAVATPVGNSWSDDFEGATCGWELINGTLTNAWVWGEAAHNGGTHSLYISNDNGTTNAYAVGSSAMVYATKLLQFADGKYEFAYDWQANGESTYDYLRVALVPASVELAAGTSTPSGFSTTALPTGWIALDGGSKLNLVTSWQHKGVAINVTSGNYYLVLAWRDDTSGGSQPPAAVDNVSITKFACPYDVAGLAVVDGSITTSSATLTWTAGDATQWQIAYSKDNSFPDGQTTMAIVSEASASLSELDASSTYFVKVRAYCGGSDFGAWSDVISFATECEALSTYPYSEKFDSYVAAEGLLPICWNRINTCTYSSYNASKYPRIYGYSAYSASNCLYLYSSYSSWYDYDPQPQYAILPEMENLAGKQITLQAKGYNATSTFKIGVMSDPADANTFTLIKEQNGLTTSYQEFTYNIPNTTTDSYVAIMIEAADEDRTTNGVYIDDIVIANPPACPKPTDLEATPSSQTATLTWNSEASGFDIAYSTDATANPDENVVGNSSTNTYSKSNLALDTDHYFWVRANCGTDGNSEWVGPISVHIGYCVPGPTSRDGKGIIGVAFGYGDDVVNNSDADGLPKASPYYGDYNDQIGAVQAGVESTIAITTSTGSYPYTFVIWVDFDNDLTFEDDEIIYTGKCASGAGILNANITIPASQALGDYRMRIAGADSYFNSFYNNGGALDYTKDHDPCLTGSKYAVFHDYTLRVLAAPSCLKPSNLAVEANAQSADLSWVSEVGAYSVAHALEATAEPNDNIVAASVSDESYEMNNLALGDHYFWVRANCGGSNGSSDWVGPVSVHIGYCEPAPTSVDKQGITNVTFGVGENIVNNSTHPSTSPYFGDYHTQIGAVQAGVEATISITYATGYTYNTYVWVDLNNNLSFEADEVVAYGESTDANPTTLTLNFTIPATQATGNYRMRIGGADSGLGSTPANANPCYTGTYGIFEDYTLRVLEAPSCLPPTALSAEVNGFGATITWASDADKFNLQYKKTAEAETAWVAVGNIEATSYAIGNLDGGTEYEVQIQANCGSSNSEWSSSVTFTTALCAAEDQCVLTFELTDSYGDSWNGNAIRVTDVLSGKVLGEMANENLNGTTGSGENEVNIKTLSVCNGREIQFSWVTGNYPNETSYVVKDVNGQVIFSGSGAMSEAINYTVDCTHKFYLEIGTSGYATFYDADYAYTMPAKLSGHTFNATTGLSDAIYEANQIIPAKEPLVMKAADDVVLPETFVLVEAETDALPSAGNDLIGVNAETYIADAADSLFYVLSLNSSNDPLSVGFYWMNSTGAGGFTMPAHKAYLKLLKPTDPTSAPAQFFLFNGENGATWLENLEGVEGTVKFLHEGKIFILREGVIYDATGRQVRKL